MSRGFWFFAGAGASAFVMIKGREYYRRLTPAGMAEQIEKKADETATAARDWWADFSMHYRNAKAAKQSELMGLLTHDERGQLE